MRSIKAIRRALRNYKSISPTLPWHKTNRMLNGADGCLFRCEVKRSSIPNAGTGRFAKQFIPSNSTLLKKKLINVQDNNYNSIWDDDKTISINSLPELNQLIDIYASKSNLSKNEIIENIHPFLSGVDNKLLLHTTSCYTNHSPNAQITRKLENGYFIYETTKNINPNDEICINYTQYSLPEFYTTFCKLNNLNDLSLVSKEWN